MPAPYPQEFREDVVRVARSREDGVTIAQIAKECGDSFSNRRELSGPAGKPMQFEDVNALSQGHEYVLLYARSEAVRRRRRPRKAPAAAVIGSVSRVIVPLVRSGRRWHRPGRMRCARPRWRRR